VAVGEVADCVGGLLWDNSVAKHFECLGVGEAVSGDVAGVESHHPFNEHWV